MQRMLLAAALIIQTVPTLANVDVHGYTKSDGTYVQPHHRSDPNSNQFDNWSTRVNINPYTGQLGYKDPMNNNSD